MAPLLCAGITTYSPLRHWGAGPGKKVGIVGLGGLGHEAVVGREAPGEDGRAHPPVEAGLGELAGALGVPRAPLGALEELGEGARQRAPPAGPVDDHAVLAVEHRLGAPAGAPGDRGHGAGRGLEKDDAEALLLQAEPPVPTGHHHEVPRTDDARERGLLDAPEEGHRGAGASDQALEPGPVAALARDEDPQGRVVARERRARTDECVHALALDEARVGDDEQVVLADPELGARGAALLARERPEALHVDPRGDDDDRGEPVGRVAPGLASRVLARGHHDRGAGQHAAQRRGDQGQPARDRHLGPVHDDAVGHREPRADQPERPGRVEQDDLGPVAGDRRFDLAARPAGGQEEGARGHPLDHDVEVGVEGRGVGVRARGQHHGPAGLEPAPELVEVVLDPAGLGGEVVRDEQVAGHSHHATEP